MQQGLFDFATPEMVDLQVDAENQAYANRPGSMLQNIAGAGSLAAIRGGTALGEGLGQVDPRKAQAQKVQEALMDVKAAGVSLNDDPVAFYKKMSEAFAARGLMQQATQASMKAMEAEEKKEDRGFKRTLSENQVTKSAYEVAEAQAKYLKAIQTAKGKPWQDNVVEYAKTGKYTPASVQAYADSGKISDLELVEKKDHYSEPYTIQDANGKPVLVRKNLNTNKVEAISQGGITIDQRTDAAEVGAAGEEFKLGLKGYSERVEAAKAVERPLAVMRKIVDSGKLTTGSAPETRTEIARLGATLGFTADPTITDNDDLFDAMVTTVLLPKMKMLGGNDSEQEMKVIRESTGSRKFTVATLGRILEVAEHAQQRAKQEQDAYRKHIGSGGKRTDWDFNAGASFKASRGSVGSGGGVGTSRPQQGSTEAPKRPVVDIKAKTRAFLANHYKREPTEAEVEAYIAKWKK